MRYRKKPVVIEAFCLGRDLPPAWFQAAENAAGVWANDEGHVIIGTLEGNMVAHEGDWIIQGVQGELYPCKPDIFVATYEEEPQP